MFTVKVLFVCGANVNRSQIAEAIFNKRSKNNQASSAGIIAARKPRPLRNQHNNPIIPMKRFGYNLSKAKVKRITRNKVQEADKVVLLLKRKLLNRVPQYIQKRTDLEFWEVKSIKDEISFEEYCKLE